MNLRRITLFLTAFVCMGAITACGARPTLVTQAEEIPAAQVEAVKVNIINTKGASIGEAILQQQANGVLVTITASGLTPGKHGFHFHDVAKCDIPDFKTAGEHFNPTQKQHGFNNLKGFHSGDLPNLVADKKGNAKAEVFVDYVTLNKGPANSLFKPNGTSIIIHAGQDDYVTDPAGNSGDRIACGIIQ